MIAGLFATADIELAVTLFVLVLLDQNRNVCWVVQISMFPPAAGLGAHVAKRKDRYGAVTIQKVC